MKSQKQRETAMITGIAAMLLVFLSCNCVFAGPKRQRLVIVYNERIKPYKNLKDTVLKQLGDKLETRTFGLGDAAGTYWVEQVLRVFKPTVIVSIGSRASQFCNTIDIAPVVSAYDINLLTQQNPFCILNYLQPAAKKVTAFGNKLTDRQQKSLFTLAAGYDLRLNIKNTKPDSWKGLLSDNSAIFLSQGVLIIKVGPSPKPPSQSSVIIVVDRSIGTYRQLEQKCVSGLPKIREIIDLSKLEEDDLHKKLKVASPAAIICIGCNSYKSCEFMQDVSQIYVALKTQSVDRDVNQWGMLSGVSMFIEPKEQTKALSLLVKKPLTLAIPYNPENTEEPVLKILLDPQGNIKFLPMPIADKTKINKVIMEGFVSYDGVWVIPDSTIAAGPIQKLLLQESLQRRKILVAMMHPYTKAGGAMAVSSVNKDEYELCDKVIKLVNERLNRPNRAGKIVSPPVFISLNLRTIKKLNYKVPELLLHKAEYLFGKE